MLLVKISVIFTPVLLFIIFVITSIIISTKYDPGECTCVYDTVTCKKNGINYHKSGCGYIKGLVLINNKLIMFPIATAEVILGAIGVTVYTIITLIFVINGCESYKN